MSSSEEFIEQVGYRPCLNSVIQRHSPRLAEEEDLLVSQVPVYDIKLLDDGKEEKLSLTVQLPGG